MTAAVDHEGAIILGPPRSGTTLLRRLLDAHPAISSPSETGVFSACARFLRQDAIAEGVKVGALSGLAFAGIPEADTLAAVRELAFGFHRRIAAAHGKKRWVSKTAFDAFYVDEIERLAGDHARFICLTRHGLDVVCSVRELCAKNETLLPELHAYVVRHPAELEAFAHMWSDLTLRIARFADDHPESAIALKYEDLVADPDASLERIFRFLGEEPEPGLAARALSRKDSIGLGDWKTYQTSAVESSSVGRSKELSAHTISRLGAIMNPTLERAGYTPVPVQVERADAEARRRYEMGLMLGGLKRPGA